MGSIYLLDIIIFLIILQGNWKIIVSFLFCFFILNFQLKILKQCDTLKPMQVDKYPCKYSTEVYKLYEQAVILCWKTDRYC